MTPVNAICRMVPSPFKKELPEYQIWEEQLLCMIYKKFLGSELTKEEQTRLDEIDHALLWYDLEILLGENSRQRHQGFILT